EPARCNAIYGLTRWSNWEPVARPASGRSAASPADDAAVADLAASQIILFHVLYGRPGYPFCLELSVSYRLEPASGLRVTVTALNAGSWPAFYGMGSHPYFTVGTSAIDDCELQIPASHWLPADERGILSGSPQDVAGTPVDFRTSVP